jgi:UDP-N-acetylmuramoylalanine--D-glutamate ligase
MSDQDFLRSPDLPSQEATPVATVLNDPAWVGARVLVVGLGESGLAMARWLSQCDAVVSVLDTRLEPPGKHALLSTLPNVRLLHARLDEVDLEGYEVLAWSPGLSIEIGDSAALFARAKARLRVVGELDLFVSAIAAKRDSGYTPKLIGITGTNGKTTVTALTTHLCNAAEVVTQAVGNISPSMLDAWMDMLAHPERARPQVWVVELSSFQLAISDLSQETKIFDAATVLNLSQDHLDWHLNFECYRASKVKLLQVSKVQVVGEDGDLRYREPRPEPVKSGSKAGHRAGLNAAALSRDSVPREKVVRFTSDAPMAMGDFGLLHDSTMVWLALATPGEEIPNGRKGVLTEIIVKRLMPADALKIRGRHNHLNAMAALALCRAIGLPLANLLHGLRDYLGEPHRCELIALLDGVDYIDDSKGTNVGATVAALKGLGKPCHLILGGEGKGQDFSPLLEPVRQHAKTVLLIGRDATLLEHALAGSGVRQVLCASLLDAVRQAAQAAVSGEVVLLSPACASFDMFKGYAHRGEVFRQAVEALAEQHGQWAPSAEAVHP